MRGSSWPGTVRLVWEKGTVAAGCSQWTQQGSSRLTWLRGPPRPAGKAALLQHVEGSAGAVPARLCFFEKYFITWDKKQKYMF